MSLSSSSPSVHVSLGKIFNYKNEFYFEANAKAGSMLAVGGTIGGFFNNINLEASYFYGFNKSETIYWSGNGKMPLSGTYTPTMNIIANVLGLGWAATPPGLKAMEELGNLEKERKTKGYENKSRYVRRASDEMCTFLIINISSLQLIPINIIAYRSQYGSANPSLIVAPAIIATLASTVAGIIYCKFAQRKKSGGKK